MEMIKMGENKKSLVIVAVTDTEMKALFSAIQKHIPQTMLIEKITNSLVYRELIGCKIPTYIVQSQMGSLGTTSIINTMHNIYQDLNPEKVVMGGIAFGSDHTKQKIGDILVSQQVWNYETSKIKDDDVIDRGDKITASSFLLQLFHSSALDYTSAKVHFGLFASGDKLVNSEKFMYQLKEREKEIIGGEMEAVGLVSVCSDKKIEWIVVKAICDWGFNKEDGGQQLAAYNAFDFIMYNLKKIIL
jgi:nucleoside phosphorylase